MAARGRKFGSSRWKQARSEQGNVQTYPISEEELSQSEIMEEIQDVFQKHGGNKKGFVTQADMQKLEGIAPWSRGELELVFAGLDADNEGCLAIEDFTAGLRSFLNSQSVTRQHRKRKMASAKTPVNLTPEEANPERKKCSEAFINQLGTDGIFEEQVAEHNRKVQQLYEEMEQQTGREKQRLQYESKTRSQLCNMEMKKVLDVREQEIQHFLTVQNELETQFVNLKENQQMANTQTEELMRDNHTLETQLQETLHQLQRTQRQLDAMKDQVAQMLKEDRASDDLTSVTTAASVSRTRVISIEEDPVADCVGEQQYCPQEPSGQSSLFKELNEAMAAMSGVSDESHEQRTGDFGFQGEEFMGKMRQSENSQQSAIQQNLPQNGGLTKNDVREKRISETLTSQATFQREVLLKEASTYVRDGALEMKNSHVFEPRMEARTPVPTPEMKPPPGIQYPLYSGWTADLHNYKEGQLQRDILASSQALIQHESHKQALKSSNIKMQELSTDSEQGEKKPSPAMKTLAKKIPSSTPVKDVVTVRFPSRTTLLRLHVGLKSETLHVHNGQFKNMPDLEKQACTTELLEGPLSEKRKEGRIYLSEFKKNQEVKAVMDEETKLTPEGWDCQVMKETSQGTRALSPHPDHLYNILFVGDTNVGKTSFLCRLQDGSAGTNVTATVGIDYRIKNLFVDDKWFALQLWDTAGQERYHSLTKQFFRKADGIVLMYDISSEHSFANVKYWLNCIQEGAENGVIVLLLGNKTDYTAERRISVNDGESLAKEYGLSFCECSAASGHNVTESMVKLARLLKTHEEQFKQEILKLVPPKKKSGCCF
ncbi:ras-related protein Rab-44 isoform X1 [Pogona vitticeps]